MLASFSAWAFFYYYSCGYAKTSCSDNGNCPRFFCYVLKTKGKMAKQEKNEQWKRLECVLDMAGMTAHRFANHIGLKRAENLYRIKKGQNGISKTLADRIAACYPQISKGWLLTGEGCMLHE